MNDDSYAHLRGEAGNRVQRTETLPDLSSVEIRGLYHELQIHQVELKLQNDELRESQCRLEQSLQNYRELFTSIPIGFATIDSGGHVVECNPAGFELLKLRPGTSFTIHQFLAVQDADRFTLLCRDVLSTQRPRQCTMPFVLSDESHIVVTIECFPITPVQEQRLGVTFQDITAQVDTDTSLRSNQAELQLLTRRLFLAQEEERQKIGRDLRDHYAQRVNGMICEIRSLRKRFKDDHEGHDSILRLKNGLKVLLDDLQFMGQTLQPLNLALRPLTHAIRGYINEFSRQTGVKTKLRLGNRLDDLSPEYGMHLYRVLQEALSNVARHAQASTVNVGLSKAGNLIKLTIADDGKGFDLKSALRQSKGLGLISMQERVRQMAGRIAIESSSSKGTSIQISIALDGSMNGSEQSAARMSTAPKRSERERSLSARFD